MNALAGIPRTSRSLFLVRFIAALLGIAGLASWADATVRHVPGDYPTIQAAINSSVDGDVVLIAPGTYSGPGNRDIELHGLAVDVTSGGGAGQTILDCQGLGRGFWVHEWEGSHSRIENLTIENGTGLNDDNYPDGGGILCEASGPTISQCRILDCHAYDGGGICLLDFGGVVDHCVISGNKADDGGGGIVTRFNIAVRITNCLVAGNSTGPGGGGGVCFADDFAGDSLDGCTITGNTGNIAGGVYTNQLATLTRCILWGNCAQDQASSEMYAGYGATFTCSDADTTSMYVWDGTIRYDAHCVYTNPEFCGPVACSQTTDGDWTLTNISPCLPQNSPCQQLIGARGQGCTASLAPEQAHRITSPVLSPGHPNPSLGRITWDLRVPSAGWMQARVIDVLGTPVQSWALGPVPAGGTTITWDGRNGRGGPAPAGQYFLVVTDAAGRRWSAPATLVR